jgi:hypothetical protein
MDNRPTKKRRQKNTSLGINNDVDNVVDLTITTDNSPLSLSARGSASASASAAISTQRNDININNGLRCCRFNITTDDHVVISLLDDSSDDDDDNGGGKLPPSLKATRNDYNAKKRSRNQLPDDEQMFICLDGDDGDNDIVTDIDTDLKKSSDPTLLVATGSASVVSLVNEPTQPTSPPHNNDSARREHRVVHQSSPFATVAESYLDTTRNSLTHEEKTRNYDDARRPQENLYKDLNHLIGQRKILIRGGDVELHNVCQGEINRIRDEISIARKNAREDIFHANNSAGGMGIQIDQGNDYDYDGSTTTSRINIDLHGQYVEDAKILFDEKVMPVLPVQKRIGVVTGRGKHSKTAKGQSKLRTGLVDHIRRMEDYRSGRMRYVSSLYK